MCTESLVTLLSFFLIAELLPTFIALIIKSRCIGYNVLPEGDNMIGTHSHLLVGCGWPLVDLREITSHAFLGNQSILSAQSNSLTTVHAWI